MTARPRARISLGWRRDDRIALMVLLGAWGIWLGVSAAGRRQAIGPRVQVFSEKLAAVREKIDPNTATAASLRRLPLIGPEKALAIVAYRRAQADAGRPAFAYLEDLAEVPGIGPGILGRAERHVTLPPRPADALPPQPPRPASQP